jgi:hypothetical protein
MRPIISHFTPDPELRKPVAHLGRIDPLRGVLANVVTVVFSFAIGERSDD